MLKKAASVFVQTLKNHGVDRFFCVPGESYLSVMKAGLALWLLQMQIAQAKLVLLL